MQVVSCDKIIKRMRKMIKRQGLENILFCVPDLEDYSSYSPYAMDQRGNFFIYLAIERLQKLNEVELNRELSNLLEGAIGYFDLAS